MLPFIERVSFAGLLNETDHLDPLQNGGILSIYQATPGSPVTIYFPCTAATDFVQNMSEYLVVGTDMFAREIRSSLAQYIGRGETNKTSPGFVGDKAAAYKKMLESYFPTLADKYVNRYRLFDTISLIGITNNPNYEGGVMVSVRITYQYAVEHVEVIIYV